MDFWKKLTEKFAGKARIDEEPKMEFKKYDEDVISGAADERAQEEISRPVAEEPKKQASLVANSGDGEGNIELKVVRPATFDEVGDIADYLIDGCTVVLNTELLDPATTIRMLDFLNGVTYSTEGEIKNVSKATYIITPRNVDVSDEK